MLAFAHNSVSYFPVDNNIYQQNSFFFLFIWYSALILGYTSINIRVFAFFSFFFFLKVYSTTSPRLQLQELRLLRLRLVATTAMTKPRQEYRHF